MQDSGFKTGFMHAGTETLFNRPVFVNKKDSQAPVRNEDG
jgi:hypothetical protein